MDDTLQKLLLTAADRAEEIGDPLLGMLKIAASGAWPNRPPVDHRRELLMGRLRSLRASVQACDLRIWGEPIDFHDPILCEAVIRIMAPHHIALVSDRLGSPIAQPAPAPEIPAEPLRRPALPSPENPWP